jgi:hypothetical protein
MKINRLFWLAVAMLLTATSCENIDAVRYISLSCQTQGYSDEAAQTEAIWEEGEEIYLFRTEDWSAALMSITSGAGSSSAKFGGSSAGTYAGYYAVRPASAAGAVRDNGIITIQAEPNNIFLAGENSAMAAPQIGSGNDKGLTFKSMFGAVKFDVSGIEKCSKITVDIPNKERGIYGEVSYRFSQGILQMKEENYTLTREFATPHSFATSQSVYVALPEGKYEKVELIVRNDSAQNATLYIAENVQVSANSVTNCSNASKVEISALVGTWHLKRFCGSEAEVDLYIDFSRYGTFTILQRTNELAYTAFEGTYTADNVTFTVTGVYSDGYAWANSYKFSLNEAQNLILQSIENPTEISEYEPAKMPVPTTQNVSRGATDVKPL